MKVQLVYYCVFWINNTPKPNSGISKDRSPKEIVLGIKPDFKRDCMLSYGSYCQVHEDLEVTNTMQSRATGAICLGPAGNYQGGYKFFSLSTKRVIKRRKWTELPVPNEVIQLVASIANAEKHNEDGFVFRRADMSAIDDIDDDPNVDDYYQPLVENVINQNPVENQQQPESNVNDIDENLDDNDAQAQDIVNNRNNDHSCETAAITEPAATATDSDILQPTALDHLNDVNSTGVYSDKVADGTSDNNNKDEVVIDSNTNTIINESQNLESASPQYDIQDIVKYNWKDVENVTPRYNLRPRRNPINFIIKMCLKE
jgi:hypothetical protein